nr:hypothetical protein [Armatimonadota bacterium]NIO98557.1 hypothetical protein [Armatimonadota bacterium]
MKNHPPSGEWRHAKTFRAAALSAVALAALGAGSVITIGVVDAHRASGVFDAKIAEARSRASFIPIDHIPEAMEDCVIANEDYLFY